MHFTADPEERFPAFVNYAQRDTEVLLVERVRADPRITLLVEHRLTAVEQDHDLVRAQVESPAGPLQVEAAYVVGCDGAGSTVRSHLGFGFEGRSYDIRFLLCDVRAHKPAIAERRLHFDPPFNRGRTVLVHPAPDSVWHIDWQVGSDPIDVAEERASGRVDERVRAVLGDPPYDLLWLTTYSFRSLKAPRMRIGRAFLAGDAAHVYSPYGARGLNSGLADADNLAWRLALVLTGAVEPTVLGGYDREREPTARDNLAITDTTARFMAPPSRRLRWRRDAVLAASRLVPSVRRLVNSGRFYEPARYGPARTDGPCESERSSRTICPRGCPHRLVLYCARNESAQDLRARLAGVST